MLYFLWRATSWDRVWSKDYHTTPYCIWTVFCFLCFRFMRHEWYYIFPHSTGKYSLCHTSNWMVVVEMVACMEWCGCGTKSKSYSYLFLHWVHLNGVSSLWMVRCSCRIPFEVKLCPHWSHTKGRSPKWTAFKWADTADLLLNLVT
jgi:hypothetical protein